MQGTFRPQVTPKNPQQELKDDTERVHKLDATGVSWEENLSHPKIRRPQLPPVPAPAAGPAPAPAAPGAPAAPAAAALVYDIVHAPMQRFTIGEYTYFIAPRDATPPQVSTVGHWLVRHIIDAAPTDVSGLLKTPVAGPINRVLGKPDGSTADNRLANDDKDDLTDAELNDVTPYPHPEYAQQFRHFLLPDPNNRHFDVGELWLRDRASRAEQLDYEFALRIQGLQNSGINAVWVCSEMGTEPSDRPDMMEQFLRAYLSRFMSQAPMSSTDDPEAIIREAIQMHQQFCAGWVREHKRSLAPTIEASAEALVGIFMEGALRGVFPADMTRREVSRIIRRDPQLGPHFGLCLHFYMVKLEQDRGSRNASYKSMVNASSSNMLSINSLDGFFRSKRALLATAAADVSGPVERIFSPRIIDWYQIVSQLPLPPIQYTGLKRNRFAAATGAVPPWAVAGRRV